MAQINHDRDYKASPHAPQTHPDQRESGVFERNHLQKQAHHEPQTVLPASLVSKRSTSQPHVGSEAQVGTSAK